MSECQELVQAALPDWSSKDVQALIRSVSKQTERHLRETPGLSFNDAVTMARASLAGEVEAGAQVVRRTAAKNALSVLGGIGRVLSASNPVEGLRSLLIGIQRGLANARRSVSVMQDSLRESYTSGLIADIAKVDGGLDLFASESMADDIARALWQVGKKEPNLDGIDPRAIDIAKAIRKWQDTAKLDANDAGANIGTLDDYITKTSHDPGRISADRAGWEAMARQTFDWARMDVDTADIPKVLGELWKGLSDGIHLKAGARPGKDLPKGAGRKLSHERVIHFKDADAWTQYNRDYGAQNLREAVMQGLDVSARATGLMRVLGPDHEATFQRIVDAVLRKMKDRGGDTKAFKSAADRYRRWYIAELDGSTSIPGDNTVASFGSGTRALQNISALGYSLFSSVSDLATVMLNAKYQGASLFDSLATTVGGLFKGVKSADRLELMADLGVAFDSIAGKITSGGRFSIDDEAGGLIGKAQYQFFRLNLQTGWTDRLRAGAAEFLSMNLARKVGRDFSQLGELKTTLGLYGIDAGKWDIIRAGALRDYEGRGFLTPNALDDAPDDLFAQYLGDTATPASINQLRGDIKRQFRSYLSDQNGYMVLKPDAAVSGALKMGKQRGTPEGEAVRLIMQFKSFPYAFTQRVVGRELKQSGWHGVARTIAATSFFGFISMTLNDLARGKVPRDPRDPRTIIAAIQKGGGAGLYSDLLFSQIVDRRFGDAGLQLFGPTASDLFGSSGLAGLAARAVEGIAARDIDKKDLSGASIRFVQGNTPFINLFWVKPALDYLVLWHMQEAVNPGSLRRMEREMEQRSGQQFIVSPSEVVNQ